MKTKSLRLVHVDILVNNEVSSIAAFTGDSIRDPVLLGFPFFLGRSKEPIREVHLLLIDLENEPYPSSFNSRDLEAGDAEDHRLFSLVIEAWEGGEVSSRRPDNKKEVVKLPAEHNQAKIVSEDFQLRLGPLLTMNRKGCRRKKASVRWPSRRRARRRKATLTAFSGRCPALVISLLFSCLPH